ncbi:MAG TPA: histidine triad nucleotide-binding protein [Proteobacteria bacterium]|nr:histidine triad nucleotide-binding protein [Pseudomonadota bacterium]
MSECIFCKIASGEVPSEKLYEDDDLFVIRDINPLAPVHLLVIPKKHIPTLLDLTDEDMPLMEKIVKVAREMAKKEGVAERGFKFVINVNEEGGQRVFHLHCHILGGKKFD